MIKAVKQTGVIMENIKQAIEVALRVRDNRCVTREEKDALAELINFVEENLEGK